MEALTGIVVLGGAAAGTASWREAALAGGGVCGEQQWLLVARCHRKSFHIENMFKNDPWVRPEMNGYCSQVEETPPMHAYVSLQILVAAFLFEPGLFSLVLMFFGNSVTALSAIPSHWFQALKPLQLPLFSSIIDEEFWFWLKDALEKGLLHRTLRLHGRLGCWIIPVSAAASTERLLQAPRCFRGGIASVTSAPSAPSCRCCRAFRTTPSGV